MMQMREEPAKVIAWLVFVVTAILNLIVLFGAPVDAEQKAGVIAVVTGFAPVVAGYLIRANVFAPDTHWDAINTAHGTFPSDPIPASKDEEIAALKRALEATTTVPTT
jgi:NAD(P)-dependent dehydrogenase (short-subunit alcohol dehydrogenase family)